jgi:hypothetical protein
MRGIHLYYTRQLFLPCFTDMYICTFYVQDSCTYLQLLHLVAHTTLDITYSFTYMSCAHTCLCTIYTYLQKLCVYTWCAHLYNPLLLAHNSHLPICKQTRLYNIHLGVYKSCEHTSLCTLHILMVQVCVYASVHTLVCPIARPHAGMHTMYRAVCILAMYIVCTVQQLSLLQLQQPTSCYMRFNRDLHYLEPYVASTLLYRKKMVHPY